jgi:hypothetical protein
MASIIIRERQPLDLPGCVALLAEVHRVDLTLEVVDQGRPPAVARYERDGWRQIATETAEWRAPDGSAVALRRFALPVRDAHGGGGS